MNNLSKRLLLILTASSLFLALFAAYFFIRNLLFPYPLTAREPSDTFGALLMLKGQNPYGLGTHPTFMYVYGIVNSLPAYPLEALFGPSMVLQRVAGAVTMVLSSSVLFWGMRVTRVPSVYALCGTLIFFSQIACNNIGGGPDNLGLFFLFLSIVVPLAGGFSWPSLAVSVVSGVIAFYTKPYFVVGAPVLIIYLFLFHSKLKALVTGGLFALLMVFSGWEINNLLPLYFTDTFYNHYNLSKTTTSYRHLIHVLLLYFPLGIALISLLIWRVTRRKNDGRAPSLWPVKFNLFNLNRPFLVKPMVGFVTFMLIVFTLIYLKVLGPHVGNLLTYVYELVCPFLIWRACIVAGVEFPERREPVLFLQATVILVFCFLVYPMVIYHTRDHGAEWRRTTDIISRHKDILNVGALASILMTQNKPVYDDGMTEYYPYSFDNNPSKQIEAYKEKSVIFEAELHDKIVRKQFDAVMIFLNPAIKPLVSRDLLTQYYQRTEVFDLGMTFENYPLEVWEPRP